MDIVNKLWGFCHTLRHEGVDYSDYIEELTYLLFLKIAEERGVGIPDDCKWATLIKHDHENLLSQYNEILNKLSKQDNILGDMFLQPIAKIRSSSALKKLLNLIDEINWSDLNEDILGATFEGLLEKAANESKKGAGQYFTPRPLIESIVKAMQPDPFENETFTMSDVACGTSGFIITSYEWWKSGKAVGKLKAQQKEKLFQQTYFGQELVIRPRRMAQMNLYLHGITPNIKLGDTIYEPFDQRQHDCILTNPPFGNKGLNQIPERKDFAIKTSNKQLNFVQHVVSCLKDNGRSAIILPDNVLTDEKALELWRHLFEFCDFHTILKLPNGTFLPYANVKAIVVFLKKGSPTKDVWFYDARTNVNSVTKKGRPLSADHFLEFLDQYGSDPNGKSPRMDLGLKGRFKKYSLKEIKNRNYNLDINWLSESDNEGELLEIEDIANEVIFDLESIIDNFKELSKILDRHD